MAERTAQNFMAVAERFGDKNANFADLPSSVLYLLAAPSTPEEVREAVANGEIPATAEAIKAAKAAREAEARAKAEAADAQAQVQRLSEQLEGVLQEVEVLRKSPKFKPRADRAAASRRVALQGADQVPSRVLDIVGVTMA